MPSILSTGYKVWSDKKNGYDFITLPDIYDNDIVYAAWVRDVIIPELKQITGGRIGRTKFIDQTKNVTRYQKWLKSEYGKQFASRVKMGTVIKDAPDEVESSTLPPMEA